MGSCMGWIFNWIFTLQGSSKHFITHSAITCSVQTDDIVASVLLLYNPATKCPLHVHAYRCDSETTAQALNQQLQILINRPENQKRFAELESRYFYLMLIVLEFLQLLRSFYNFEVNINFKYLLEQNVLFLW